MLGRNVEIFSFVLPFLPSTKKGVFFRAKIGAMWITARPCPTWKKNQAAFSNWLVSLSPMEPTTKTTRESGSPGGPKGWYGSFSRQGRFWSGFWLIAAVVWRFLAVSVLQLIKFWNPFGMRPLTSNHICEVYESMSNWRAGKGTEVVGRTLVHQKAGASTSALEERAARRFFQFFTMVFVCICEVLLVMMYYDIRLWICGWLWWRCLWWWMVNQEGCMMMCGSVWWWVMYTDVFVMKTMKMMMNIMKIWWKRWHWYYGSIMVLFNVTNMCLHIYVYIYICYHMLFSIGVFSWISTLCLQETCIIRRHVTFTRGRGDGKLYLQWLYRFTVPVLLCSRSVGWILDNSAANFVDILRRCLAKCSPLVIWCRKPWKCGMA